jgi:hypothetical protein
MSDERRSEPIADLGALYRAVDEVWGPTRNTERVRLAHDLAAYIGGPTGVALTAMLRADAWSCLFGSIGGVL